MNYDELFYCIIASNTRPSFNLTFRNYRLVDGSAKYFDKYLMKNLYNLIVTVNEKIE